METTNIKVSIAKLGTSIQEVEVPTWATVMQALRKAGYNLDWVVSVKRNGTQVQMDDVLSHQDVLLVSMDKIKGWVKWEEKEEEANLLKLSFVIQKESQATVTDQVAFLDNMTTFDIIKEVMRNRGVSLNDFKEIRDEENNTVSLGEKLVDGWSYKIIICDKHNCGEPRHGCCDDEDYSDED